MDFIIKYMISPFNAIEHQGSRLHSVYLLCSLLCGLYLIFFLLYALYRGVAKGDRRQANLVGYLYVLPASALLGYLLFAIYLAPIILIATTRFACRGFPGDEGCRQFSKDHGFEQAGRFEYPQEMKKYFPNGYRLKEMAQYADPGLVKSVRKKIIRSSLLHFAAGIMLNLILYTLRQNM